MEKIKREVHGFMHNGERVFLGRDSLTDEEVTENLKIIGLGFKAGVPGEFSVGTAVFNLSAFAGVQITPPVKQ